MSLQSASIQEERVESSYLKDWLLVSFHDGSVLEPSDSLSPESRRDWIMIETGFVNVGKGRSSW
jgi:hypothetical protein